MSHDRVAPPRPMGSLPSTRAIRRTELRKIVPLADTTIYEMERRGEFPRRFPLTRRCVVWDLGEVEAWLEARKREAFAAPVEGPDVRARRTRPVKGA
ncbi:helix-turn-helix transcriptional regulator [Caulobacter endophyticus]|uniref:Transcriptional regulator n=1 Tax=Caulobacter endophyticus TaxID=2172652 RepID=A0A2T9KA18_9CAUL|nr:AlpA family phage regulatory protein [Caulobacter endophyticus]PVM92776.1 transcriptional regulator [Caulobacter endophyticus]